MKPMQYKFSLLVSLMSVFAIITSAQTVSVKGSVFLDANNNGLRDANENGIKGVTVSDQAASVITDAAGFFQLQGKGSPGFIFVTQPDGFAVKGSIWKPIPSNQSEINIDFAMTKATKPARFTFIHASDTHISEASVN